MNTVILLLIACGRSSSPEPIIGGIDQTFAKNDQPAAPAAAPPPAAAASSERKASAKPARSAVAKEEMEAPADEGAIADGEGQKGGEEGEGAERTRSWFPEAFLWRPLVETGDDGVAELELTVPDQLTTWRVLALAADASGQQSGTLHTFDSTLPVYVDPVVPGWLYAGDRIAMPVQAVNTTQRDVSAQLTLRSTGALRGEGAATVALGPGGSDVRTLPLVAEGAGGATVLARLSAGADSDSAERTFPVLPTGRPVERSRGGTLTDTRSLELAGPEQADPTTEEVEVVIFAGPLAVVQAEVARIEGGARPEDGAYGFALVDRVDQLSAAAGVPVDASLDRRLRILAWQRVVRDLRAPDAGTAADLLTSMRGVHDHEQAVASLPLLVSAVTRGQRADGAWARRDRSTLQEILVNTAFVGRTLDADGQQAQRLSASGFLERFLHEVKDPYTAAVLLASGLLDHDAEQHLREILDEAISHDDQGTPSVADGGDVVSPWGIRPSHAERLAWTVLALPADHADRGDLAAELMQQWDARWGFGAGRADALALEAVVSALPGVSSPVDVTLEVGDAVATGKVDPAQPRLPVLLAVRPQGSDAPLKITASPPVPGLAFVATRRSWVPWTDDDRLAGVACEVTLGDLEVGREGVLHLTLSAPSGSRLHVEQGLPAGAVIPEEFAQRYPRIGEVRVLQDRLMFDTASFGPGEILEIDVPVTPAFAGTFSTAPLLLGASRASAVAMEPVLWTVTGP